MVKVGTILKYTRDDSRNHAFILNDEYEVVGQDADGDYRMTNEAGFVSPYGCPLNGNFWDF
ncbi:hypothetical protein MVUOKPPV_CDS0234 [Klebsiella phage phi1_175008]|uniref:Uncharacterized protein n=1 Tax=Klebsiella phage phi1_175008 TaxID=3127744 RepID=A0ACD5FRS3_9CAUD